MMGFLEVEDTRGGIVGGSMVRKCRRGCKVDRRSKEGKVDKRRKEKKKINGCAREVFIPYEMLA